MAEISRQDRNVEALEIRTLLEWWLMSTSRNPLAWLLTYSPQSLAAAHTFVNVSNCTFHFGVSLRIVVGRRTEISRPVVLVSVGIRPPQATDPSNGKRIHLTASFPVSLRMEPTNHLFRMFRH